MPRQIQIVKQTVKRPPTHGHHHLPVGAQDLPLVKRKATPMNALTAATPVRLLLPGSAPLAIATTLSYDPVDPYAVTAVFAHPDGEIVEWILSRDHLTIGQHKDAGIGDVRIWPSTEPGVGVVYLSISSPEGEALLEIDATALMTFLVATHRMVPAGSEHRHIDIDALIGRIYAEA